MSAASIETLDVVLLEKNQSIARMLVLHDVLAEGNRRLEAGDHDLVSFMSWLADLGRAELRKTGLQPVGVAE